MKKYRHRTTGEIVDVVKEGICTVNNSHKTFKYVDIRLNANAVRMVNAKDFHANYEPLEEGGTDEPPIANDGG